MSHQVQLQKPTNDPVILCETACNLFRESWSGEPVRLLGIRTSKLVEENAPEQLTIFDIELPKEPDEKHKKLNAGFLSFLLNLRTIGLSDKHLFAWINIL